MNIPLFPSLKPKLIDPSWFDVDQPCDDEEELYQLEKDHQTWLQTKVQRNLEQTPIGKSSSENLDDDEEDDEEDDNDEVEEESESHEEEDDDEIDMEVPQDRNSPIDVHDNIQQDHNIVR